MTRKLSNLERKKLASKALERSSYRIIASVELMNLVKRKNGAIASIISPLESQTMTLIFPHHHSVPTTSKFTLKEP